MRRISAACTALFVSLFIAGSTGADAPLPGVFLAAPGALAGTSFASPSFLFGDDPRAASWNPASGASRELPAFGAAAALAFPVTSGSGAGGYATISAAVPTAVGTVWIVADGVRSAPSVDSWAAPTGASFTAGLSKKAADRLSFGLGVGAGSADGDGRTWGVSASFGAELSLPDLGPAGSDLSASILSAGPSFGGFGGTLVAPTPVIALRTRLADSPRFSVSASALLAAPAFADPAGGAGLSFSLGRYLTLDLGWHWSIADAREWFDTGDPDHAFRALPAVSIRLDGTSFLRLGDYGAALSAESRSAGSGAAVAGASAVFSRGERDTSGPEVSLGGTDGTAYSPRIVDSVRLPFRARDASRIAEWRVVAYGPDGSPVFSTGDGAAAESRGMAKRLFSAKTGLAVPPAVEVPIAAASMDGEYRIRATAKDEHGNEGRAAERSIVLDRVPPAASVRVIGPPVFTPNGDGARDILTIDQEGSREERWIGTFRAANGNVVRVFEWTDSQPSGFAWDGRSDSGTLLPDGRYTYTLEAVDAAGNKGGEKIEDLRLDAAPTPLGLRLDGAALSSDREASITSILLTLDAPRRDGLAAWKIALVGDGGKTYREWNGSAARLDAPPETLRFDGRDREGDPVPDGRYRFRATFEYENGNMPSALSAPFVVDSKRPNGRVRVSSAVFALDGGTYLSLYQDLSAGAEWRGLVMDEGGAIVRSLPLGSGTETVAEWNGLDSAGIPVTPGRYSYAAEGRNGVGLVGRTSAASFRVESGGRTASLVLDRGRFSAVAGDSRLRILPRVERRDRIVSYGLEIKNVSGSVARRYDGIAALPAAISWDGRDDFGSLAPDGEYLASLSVLFEGGQRVAAESARVILDSTPPGASLALESSIFSPNGDGALDAIVIDQNGAGVEKLWTGELLDDRDDAVRTFSWKELPPRRLVWDGRDADGSLLPDGRYRYRLSSTDAAGNSFAAETAPFVLDGRVPTVALSADKTAFSPNGDGFADALSVRVVPSFSDGLGEWAAYVVDGAGERIRTLAEAKSSGPPPRELRWDGSSDDGRRAKDGTYKAVAVLRYAKGDAARAESAPFLLDASPPSVALSLSPLPFSPDGDGQADELVIDLRAKDESPLAGWSLSIIDPAGYPFTVFSGRSMPAAPFAWDGRNLDGELVEAAQDYSYELLVRDALGNARKESGAVPVDVFVLRDGDRLKIRVSSITFAPSSSSLSVGDPRLDAKNRAVLDRIASVLDRYPDYRIRVEGHAVNVSGTEREERTELAPLSLARARAVVEALAARGVGAARLEARGLGGSEPIVPHGDVASRWRNRRVEFILMR